LQISAPLLALEEISIIFNRKINQISDFFENKYSLKNLFLKNKTGSSFYIKNLRFVLKKPVRTLILISNILYVFEVVSLFFLNEEERVLYNITTDIALLQFAMT